MTFLGMSRVAVVLAVIVALFVDQSAGGDRSVTVQELFRANHRIEVDKGTRIVFGDPHFDRVWFRPERGPVITRTDIGLSATFDTPGEYRGNFTVVGGHGTTDVYPLTVIVR